MKPFARKRSQEILNGYARQTHGCRANELRSQYPRGQLARAWRSNGQEFELLSSTGLWRHRRYSPLLPIEEAPKL